MPASPPPVHHGSTPDPVPARVITPVSVANPEPVTAEVSAPAPWGPESA